MGRNYPRFIYSDPQNTKSRGPFIVHTVYPKFIGKVNIERGSILKFQPEILEFWDEASAEEYLVMQGQMATWYRAQISSGEIKLQTKKEVTEEEVRKGNRFVNFIVDGFNSKGVFYTLTNDEYGRPNRVVEKQISELEPIQLTPEVLNKCGTGLQKLIYNRHTKNPNVWCAVIDNNIACFQYLHQFQNLFEDIAKKPLVVPMEI